jgi:GntR family transcriptional regulator / MocR family aminotransferase
MAFSYLVELPKERTHLPLHVQIAQAIADDIANGRLRAGTKLPGSRTLAKSVGVHRNTINAALHELSAQGWVESAPARGVFVKPLEEVERARAKLLRARGVQSAHATLDRPRFALGSGTHLDRAPIMRNRNTLLLTGGVPDPRLFPVDILGRAYRRTLQRHGKTALDYGSPYGVQALRHALSTMLNNMRGLCSQADNVLITRGSQQAIWLAAQALISPGDRVGIEAFGYPPAWQALREAGAELVPLSVDEHGVRVDAIQNALQRGPLRALYLTPHHQYPTMVSLSPARRLALMQLAHEHRIAILEDDYTNEFQYEGRPRLPLASADRSGCVVYIGTLSKILAPGLRIGYAIAPTLLIERMAARRFSIDRQGDNISELVAADLIEEGDLPRHVRKMRTVYMARRAILVETLRSQLGGRVSFDVPQGGMNLWVRTHDCNVEAWVARTQAKGVLMRAGSELSYAAKKLPYVRMGFTALDERELVRAVKVAASVIDD